MPPGFEGGHLSVFGLYGVHGRGGRLGKISEMWDRSRNYIRIALKNVEVEVSLGLHAWERHPERPTRLLVSVDLFSYQAGQNRSAPINYDMVRRFLKTWKDRPHTELLEDLAEDLIVVCFEDPNVDACRVELIKPDIFNEAEGAGIEIYRRREG